MSNEFKNIPIKTEPSQNSATETISLYEKQKTIHVRQSHGRFTKLRIFFVIATQLVFFGLPWLTWNDRQAVLWDLANRKFYIFGLTIWPQDFVYLAALLMLSAFGLFVWTTIAGRLWCGYSCPQTVYTEIMLWIESWVEGDRNARIKLEKQPWNLRKIRLKTTKHGLMLTFALVTGFTFVGYFSPIQELALALPSFAYSGWETFWILFYAGFTYLLAAIMREQVCKYMCPYARFQSVMFDKDTLIISYDEKRGEPRGARRKNSDEKLGFCINCGICVQVCPVGIDIRDGLQYECIGCAACIDACDEVMDKIKQPRGLVRYSTEAALTGEYPEKDITKRLKRPRVILYAAVLSIILISVVTSFALRKPFKVDIIRDRASLVRETNEGWLENSYSIRIINLQEKPIRYEITVSGLESAKLSQATIVTIPALGNELTGVRVEADPEFATKGSHKIYFTITSLEDQSSVEEKSSFIGE